MLVQDVKRVPANISSYPMKRLDDLISPVNRAPSHKSVNSSASARIPKTLLLNKITTPDQTANVQALIEATRKRR